MKLLLTIIASAIITIGAGATETQMVLEAGAGLKGLHVGGGATRNPWSLIIDFTLPYDRDLGESDIEASHEFWWLNRVKEEDHNQVAIGLIAAYQIARTPISATGGIGFMRTDRIAYFKSPVSGWDYSKAVKSRDEIWLSGGANINFSWGRRTPGYISLSYNNSQQATMGIGIAFTWPPDGY
jgi:hypothetical protein